MSKIHQPSCVWFSILALLSATTHASELDVIRLFHDPPLDAPNDIEPGPLAESDLSAKQHKETWVQLATQDPSDAINSDMVYQYHGFVSSRSGIQYLINGVPLLELSSLKLLSVGQGGRVLELQTTQGRVFQLSIGESIDRDSL